MLFTQEWQRTENTGQRACPTGRVSSPTLSSHFTELVLVKQESTWIRFWLGVVSNRDDFHLPYTKNAAFNEFFGLIIPKWPLNLILITCLYAIRRAWIEISNLYICIFFHHDYLSWIYQLFFLNRSGNNLKKIYLISFQATFVAYNVLGRL